MSELWQQAIVEAFQDTGRRMALFLPNLLAVISLLLVGLLAGWFAKALLSRLLRALRFDSLCERWGVQLIAIANIEKVSEDLRTFKNHKHLKWTKERN